jgi:hypothetical protein
MTRRALRSVRTRFEAVTNRRERLPETLSTLRRRFVLASFHDVEKLPAQSDREIRVASEFLRIAERHADQDDWSVVRTAIGDTRRALDNATTVIAAVTDRLKLLEEIAANPQAPVKRTRSVVRDAQRYLASKGDAVRPVDGERLETLSQRVDEIERVLKGARPNYWRANQDLVGIRGDAADLVRRIRDY